VVAGLALLLVAGLWWQRRRAFDASVNLGLACAALLGVLVTGAAGGAIFATQAAPEGNGDANAQSGVLLAGAEGPRRASKGATRAKRVGHAARARIRTAAPTASPATPPAPSDAPKPEAGSAPSPAPAARASAPAAEAATYVVRPGDSLSAIARSKLPAGSSSGSIAKTVDKLADLNLDSRIQSGDPDFIEAGERLKLP
jgi:nucleoid-associated protein YgaU